jgi:hypothetical protein
VLCVPTHYIGHLSLYRSLRGLSHEEPQSEHKKQGERDVTDAFSPASERVVGRAAARLRGDDLRHDLQRIRDVAAGVLARLSRDTADGRDGVDEGDRGEDGEEGELEAHGGLLSCRAHRTGFYIFTGGHIAVPTQCRALCRRISCG